jgi:acetyl-CoA carboxylase carboxyltransferase component
MAFEDILDDLAIRRGKALAMGTEQKLAQRRAQGLLDARSRLDYLLDAGSFQESGLFAASDRKEMRDRTPADGKIAGFGRIDGRRIGVVSNDFTVMGASSASINSKKMGHVKAAAEKRGFPMVFLGESAGATPGPAICARGGRHGSRQCWGRVMARRPGMRRCRISW